jgi:hypothetical protein
MSPLRRQQEDEERLAQLSSQSLNPCAFAQYMRKAKTAYENQNSI